MTIKIALLGASGRMGKCIVSVAAELADVGVVGRASEGEPLVGLTSCGAQVAIDFSSPQATLAFLPLAARAKLPLVIGTTGLGGEQLRVLDEAAAQIPIFVSSNMSVGVYVLGELLGRASEMLGDSFDVEIVETHHRRKVDAPSGTALTLLEIATAHTKESRPVFGRNGKPGARPTTEIGVHAVRGGDVVGDHHVHFLGDGERLELTHRATSREVFARGAIRAARWLVGKPAGKYGMADLFR